jgi:two-component system LytT family response regulator
MRQCKILIADDEMLARHAIKLALPQNSSTQIVAECADGEDAVAKIQQHLPDVIFLDIQMPLLSGFEVLDALPANYDPHLIIVSAHDYAVKAFEHDAADYLLKPFTQMRFNKAFEKALRSWESGSTNAEGSFSKRIQQIIPIERYRKLITIKDGIKMVVIPCEEVTYIEACGDYTSIHTATKKYLHNETLKTFEIVLDPVSFARIHRSFIVNIRFIKELISHYNGDYTVALKNGELLKLSRNYRAQLLQLMS